MAELSNHSYHYDRNSLINIPTFVSQDDDIEDDKDADLQDRAQKKKSRRKKRMLTGVSKQRRAANERERKRLQIINSAFKDLKAVLPLFPNENSISKIEIVRLASRTIRHLSEILNNGEMSDSASPRGSESSESDASRSSTSSLPDPRDLESFLMSAHEDFNINDHFATLAAEIGEDVASNNGFSGLDISCFVKEEEDIDDVFPSMIF